ncbi:paraquat-inducible protein A [Pseudomonas sp. M30-35]|uniref:paraquat-inducible protein A n=1 Tax=Pseudomonas sp. M30-35 TaxID=1981174 RepID=UPI000B3BFEAD|nr:paraquat-inducible protein A [Pseudomonas sp. M30-35]ARU87443.1 paraquat-inducible protein A [Pseudomonas sp. M30-35]
MPEPIEATSLTGHSIDQLIACHECDLLMQSQPVEDGERIECPRCGYELYSHRHQVIRRSMALVIAALLLYIPANFLPIIELNLLGQQTQDTVWSGVLGLYHSGMQPVALVVFLSSMVIPLFKLLIQFFVLLSIRFDFGRSYGLLFYRMYHHMREWGMLEVYLMGILVAVVKLVDVADLTFGIGLLCFVALLLLQVWLEVTMSPHQIWQGLSGGEHASEGH